MTDEQIDDLQFSHQNTRDGFQWLAFARAIEAARDAQWEAMLAAPHEAKTHEEKTAYAFGWFKALETARTQPAPDNRPTGWTNPQARYAVPILFNPYTGERRDERDVQSDPRGELIVPPGMVDIHAAQEHP
jgi:hypothetical protein